MNRKIKFRAWDKRTRKMIETGFHVLGETTCFDLIYTYCMEHGKRKNEPGLLRMNSVVLMQFTGLHDKNGKEIYEGDILKVIDPMGDTLPNWTTEWNKTGCYAYEPPNGFDNFDVTSLGWAMDMEYTFEVIGNIYESKELLDKVE